MESTPGLPLPTGHGPASAAIATLILRLQLAAWDGAVDSGSEGDSNPDSISQRSIAAETASDDARQALGLDGTISDPAGSGGENDAMVDDRRGHGNWGHGPAAPWTAEQDLQVLMIYEQYPDWTADQIAVEFNNHFPNVRPRTGQALRQRRASLRRKRETMESVAAKLPRLDKGDGSGPGDTAGGATGAIAV